MKKTAIIIILYFVLPVYLLASAKDSMNIQTIYFSSGKVQSIAHFKNQMLHGKFIAYYNNGRIKEVGKYKLNLSEGKWKKIL